MLTIKGVRNHQIYRYKWEKHTFKPSLKSLLILENSQTPIAHIEKTMEILGVTRQEDDCGTEEYDMNFEFRIPNQTTNNLLKLPTFQGERLDVDHGGVMLYTRCVCPVCQTSSFPYCWGD